MTHSGVVPLLDRVADAVSDAIGRTRPELAGADPVLRRSERADFQSNAALALAERLGIRPAEYATELVAALAPGTDRPVAAAAVSGPGFVNITVPDRVLWAQVTARLADARLGVPATEHGRRTVLDYSAPNIAKEMHVGHLRTTIIGDSLARVLGFLGAVVIRQNHLGDWGTQFGMLIQYLDEHPDVRWRHDDVAAEGAAVSALDRLYRAARAAFDADPDFAVRSRARVVALQAGDSRTLDRWRDIVAESERAFAAIYAKLGVLLTPDDSVGESFYNPLLSGVVAELLEQGVAVDSNGATVVFSTEVTGPDDAPVPLMVRKSDGGYGYDTTDLATIRHRIDALHAQRLLYVTDSRQALHFRLIFETARRAGWLRDGVEAEHVPFGTVLGPDGTPFKTRAGGTVRLGDLLDDAVARARAVVAAKNPELTDAELDAIATQSGIGAVKYADLSTARVKDYTFDLDRMVAFTGNTAVYLQYAHARIRSLLGKAGAPEPVIAIDGPLAAAERALVLTLDAYGATVAEVGSTLEPHRLCGYLYQLARTFTAFYDACPVLKADAPQRGNRLALCDLTARTLAHGLDLLGIAAPERM
ncbi:arginine--tRNA ligase [Nocardia brasiliensis]|uniref:arginine--tRNA ligase n=1 Tax=Nocardia brasiliensis TaxID=37326 RepID=UPI003D8E0CD4